MKYILIALLLIGCNKHEKEPFVYLDDLEPAVVEPHIEMQPTNNSCAWWAIPNQDYNGVPKYSGPMCTYTHKHIPVAAYGNGEVFYTTTEFLDGDFYVYAHKGVESVLVHQINDWDDPHTNAAIQIDNQGRVNVHVASRGLDFKFQSGKHLRSVTPYELDFECLSGCGDVNFEAYPQVFDTSFGYYVGYTHYVKDPAIHPTRNVREIWYNLNGSRTRLAKGAHYQVTYYHNGTIYVFFNYLKNAAADERYNLYGMKTSDGVNWTNLLNEPLSLPVEQDDDIVRLYETESVGNLVYLKDITYKLGVRALFTEATTKDPTLGERYVKEFWYDDGEDPIKTVSETNHNYSSAAYIEHKNNTYIVLNKGVQPYAGGDISLFKVYLSGYNLVDTANSGNYSYIRKVYGVDSMAVSGFGNSDVQSSSEHVMIFLAD